MIQKVNFTSKFTKVIYFSLILIISFTATYLYNLSLYLHTIYMYMITLLLQTNIKRLPNKYQKSHSNMPTPYTTEAVRARFAKKSCFPLARQRVAHNHRDGNYVEKKAAREIYRDRERNREGRILIEKYYTVYRKTGAQCV